MEAKLYVCYRYQITKIVRLLSLLISNDEGK